MMTRKFTIKDQNYVNEEEYQVWIVVYPQTCNGVEKLVKVNNFTLSRKNQPKPKVDGLR